MKPTTYLLILASVAVILIVAIAWQPRTTHRKIGWRATDFFDDPKVVALCQAIEKDDLLLMERLIKEGADVNARGVGNVTPLLWAFFDNHPRRVELLLQHGADPNVFLTKTFGHPQGKLAIGASVTELAAGSSFEKQFYSVMKFGGNPNLVNPRTKDPILFTVINGDNYVDARIRLLIEHNVNLNAKDGSEATAPMIAIVRWQQYDLALFLLQSGADFREYHEFYDLRLIHYLVKEQQRPPATLPPPAREALRRLIAWLAEQGESIDEAQEYLEKRMSLKTKEDRVHLRKTFKSKQVGETTPR